MKGLFETWNTTLFGYLIHFKSPRQAADFQNRVELGLHALPAMDHSQAKLSRCTSSSTCYLGRLIGLLSEKRDKYASALEVRDVKVHASYSLLYIVGRKGSNRHIRVMVVSKILPSNREDESNHEVKSFLEALSHGTVRELRGCLIVEFTSQIIYMGIVRANEDTIAGVDRDRSVPVCMLRLIVVDSGGDCHSWQTDPIITPTSKDHGWRYIANFRIHSLTRYGERLIRLWYDQSSGEVVFVSRRDGPNLGGYCEAPVFIDEVNVCSLHFAGHHIQLSRCITLCTLSQIQDCHYTAHGVWIVCTDLGVHYYDYCTCRMLKFDGIQKHLSAHNIIEVPSKSIVCISPAHASLRDEQHQRLYVLVQETLYSLHVTDCHISCVAAYSLKHVLHHRGTSGSGLLVQDMLVPAEHTTDGGAVVCLITSERCYILQLRPSWRSICEPDNAIPPVVAVREYVVMDIPKLHGHTTFTAPPYFIPLPEPLNGTAGCVALVCRGTSVFAMQIDSVDRTAASPERHPYRSPFRNSQLIPIDQLWQSLFADRARQQHLHSNKDKTTSPHFTLSQPAHVVYTPSVSSVFADSTLKQLLVHANSARAEASAAALSLDETLRCVNTLFADASQLDIALLAECTDTSDSLQAQGRLTISFIRSILSSLQSIQATHIQASAPISRMKREISMPNFRRENLDLSARHWLDELNILTLLPPLSAERATSEYLSRTIESLLLMQLSQCLQPHRGDDVDHSDTAHNRTLLGIVLRIVALTRPNELVSLVHALMQVEYQSAMHGRNTDETAQNDSTVPSNKSQTHPANIVRTIVGAPPVDPSVTHVPIYHHSAPPRHTLVEEDDDIFGISTVVQHQQQAQRPALNLQIRHRMKNLSRTEYISCGNADEVLDKEAHPHEGQGQSSAQASEGDTAAEGSESDGDGDGEDAFGVFRNVGDEESDGDHGSSSPKPASVSVDQEQTPCCSGAATGTAAATAEQLQRILSPLLTSTFSANDPAESNSAPHLTLQDRCTDMAISLLRRQLSAARPEDPKLSIAQEDGLLKALLLCGGAVTVAEYLIQARRFKALAILTLRTAASANAMHAAGRDPLTSAYHTEGRGRLVREADQVALDSHRQYQDSRGAVSHWDAVIDAVLSPTDDNLPTAMKALCALIPNQPIEPTVPQLRALEAIVVLKLALRCFLGKQVLVEIYFNQVQELLRYRPAVVTMEVARAWVRTFAVSTEHRDKILRTCTA